MRYEDNHLSDCELVMAMDAELPSSDATRVTRHLSACWTCRARQHELEAAADSYVQYHQSAASSLSAGQGPRALLKANLARLAAATPVAPGKVRIPLLVWGVAAAVAVLLGIAIWPGQMRDQPQVVALAVPNPSLTPGAAVLLDRTGVCSAANVKNRDVPSNLRRKVLEEYGLANQQGRYYEVDYLITPALGGAEDIHNLWPQSYSNTSWNAEVKDALEDHLRDMVCSGEIELATAQREIAMNWIDAYKKYFRTDRPIGQVQQ